MKIAYVPKKFTKGHENTIRRANEILERYAQHGFVLTLRQLYYQFIAKDFFPNTLQSYKRLGGIIADARLAGKIDWLAIEDRVRYLASLENFVDGQDAMNSIASRYHIDMWENQKYRPEVWIEKDALSGVISRVCNEHDVPYFSCRGYTSISEMWRASMRLREHEEKGQRPFVIHFGDHDPSGMDMSRDIVDRLHDKFGADFDFVRVALNMDQIIELNPPPNWAKLTDSRFKKYRETYDTDKSWELDAIEPTSFKALIERQLNVIRDDKQWKADVDRREGTRKTLEKLRDGWLELPEREKALKAALAARTRLERSYATERALTKRLEEEKDELRKELASERAKKGRK